MTRLEYFRPALINAAATKDAWLRWTIERQWDRYITLSFNEPAKLNRLGDVTESEIASRRDKLKEWDGRMNRCLLGRNWAKLHDYRMFNMYTMEKPRTNPHFHGLVHFFNVDEAERERQAKIFDDRAEDIWKYLVASGDVDVKPVFNELGVANYVGKSITDSLNFENWVPPDEFWRP
ncbi:hypothetical protein NIM87_13320 [Devosia sp. XJ19-1]|uniref:Replication protein n=1 Tax=Devosia ureilytica TaxID=2952754 RepID=A0A9Q4APT8_9HYPH|nr:hypothetical protein [Devosia ureilytica]MCP8884494.1 hypothetical protein [Devosia ureilytica]MCP8888124.1 hypothetical protein [Devosia ureilytica]